MNIDSEKIRDVVIAVDEVGEEGEKNKKRRKIQNGETECADKHRGDQVGPEIRNQQGAEREGNDRVVDGLARGQNSSAIKTTTTTTKGAKCRLRGRPRI